MKGSRALAFSLACLLLLTACGKQDAEPTSEATGAEAAVEAAAPDVVSGCWTASQRAEGGESGGSDSMANHLQWSEPPAMIVDPAKRYSATIETNKGDIAVEFFPGDAPATVNNFVCLARAGYYDNTPVHRIVSGFVIQGGDPTGTGTGGPGYRFNDEPIGRDYEKGMLAMANAGPNTNGSQFFIVLEDLRGQLPKNYTIFGRVTGGQEAVDAIAQTPTRPNSRGERSVPTEPVTIERVTITEA